MTAHLLSERIGEAGVPRKTYVVVMLGPKLWKGA